MGPHHPECPERLAAINDMLLTKGLLDYMAPYDAEPATIDQLERAHSALYVQELFAASPTEGYHHVDPDTSMNPHALDVHGLERVALIDFDVHHANGSEDILRGDERVLMCSIYEKGLFPDSGDAHDGPNMVNVGLPARVGSDAFREAVVEQWLPALDAFAPQLIYISAAFDAHREDDMGNLALVEADYAWVPQQIMRLADRHCRGRVISCLEGGYALSALARSTAAHVRSLIGAD